MRETGQLNNFLISLFMKLVCLVFFSRFQCMRRPPRPGCCLPPHPLNTALFLDLVRELKAQQEYIKSTEHNQMGYYNFWGAADTIVNAQKVIREMVKHQADSQRAK